MKKIAIIAILNLISFGAFSADIPVATDTGTITIKGNVFAQACVLSSPASTLKIPTTYASAYTAKGDMSPQGISTSISFSCSTAPVMAGVYITVQGDADGLEPSLFKVPEGTGKATGVAIKLSAKSVSSTSATMDITPNKESVIMPKAGSSNSTSWAYVAQAVSVADKVTSGDLSTNLTWTARYN